MRFVDLILPTALAAVLSWPIQANATKTYDDYLTALGQRESGNNYGISNSLGYLGRFQFGEAALTDCRFYGGDSTRKNDWAGTFRDEAVSWGVVSKDDFLRTPGFQDFAILRFNELQWAMMVRLDLPQFVGTTVGGIVITRSGMLGGAHLVGPGALKKFLLSNGAIVPVDGNGTPITEYIQLFSSYDVPFH
jgi:hypothetical protein